MPPSHTEELERPDPSYPRLLRRYVSTLLDGFLLLVIVLTVPDFLQGTAWGVTAIRVSLFLFLALGYEPLLTWRTCTLGQYVMGIRVRRASDPESHINLLAAYVRYLVKIFLGFISLFTIVFTRRRQAIHDLVTRSVMIDTRAAARSG